MLEHSHHVGEQHRLLTSVVDDDIFVGTIKVLLGTYGQRKRRRLVDGVLHLVNVPVGTEKGRVDHADIGADALHLLRIPQREGIIVSVSDQYAVLTHRVEIVGSHLGGGAAVRAVVVVPVLGGHKGRHEQARDRSDRSHGNGAAPLQGIIDPIVYGRHSQAYPYRE